MRALQIQLAIAALAVPLAQAADLYSLGSSAEPSQLAVGDAWGAALQFASEASASLIPAWVQIQLSEIARVVSIDPLTGVAVGAVVLLLVLIGLRQRGDLVVAIAYPPELRGTFRVRLATSKRRAGKGSRRGPAEILKGGTSTQREHHLVSRETQFPRLAARRYFVLVEGVLQDPESEEVIAAPLEIKEIRVRPRRTVRRDFDLRPEKCPVDVSVFWDGEPAHEVAVAARGLPETLHYAEAGVARIHLHRGPCTIAVGCGDRVVERDIEIRSFQPVRIAIDVAGGDKAVFRGCPPAVEPYLLGDFDASARALERDGQSSTAHLILARMHSELGRSELAADHYERAGRPLEAAELRAALSDFAGAAALFEQAGEPLCAAEMYRSAGEYLLAGRAYEKAGEFDNAVGLYREAGEVDAWIEAVERRGRIFEAGKIALEGGQVIRAIGLLRRVAPEDESYATAAVLLADAFEREGHFDLAAQKLAEHLGATTGGGASAPIRMRLSDLLERAGDLDGALAALEDLRRREPNFPNVSTRIELLRKEHGAKHTVVAPGEPDLVPTAFLPESRYELLEEIGRGGMGVVFKARDRRLNRVVALKRLPENLRRDHPRAVQFFLREAQTSARLNHPNIVTVYDTDQEDGVFFITMELLDGKPLHHVLREKGRIAPIDVARIAVQAASGLAYAHEQAVIHRDIKTANLFLTSDTVVKVMDFGLAKVIEQVRGAESVVGGTPFYMAPEQSLGGPVDHRADLYSLGVTLFELSTGRVPFPDGDASRQHRETPVPDPRHAAPDLPDPLVELIFDLMSKLPHERCSSAREVIERLDPVLRLHAQSATSA